MQTCVQNSFWNIAEHQHLTLQYHPLPLPLMGGMQYIWSITFTPELSVLSTDSPVISVLISTARTQGLHSITTRKSRLKTTAIMIISPLRILPTLRTWMRFNPNLPMIKISRGYSNVYMFCHFQLHCRRWMDEAG